MGDCNHASGVLLGYRRRLGKGVEARYSLMYVRECLRCGVLPQGEANNRGLRGEIALARVIGLLHRLWEPGRRRNEIIDATAATYAVKP